MYTTESLCHECHTAAAQLVDHGQQQPQLSQWRSERDEEWQLPAQRAHGRTSRLTTATFINVCSSGARYGLKFLQITSSHHAA